MKTRILIIGLVVLMLAVAPASGMIIGVTWNQSDSSPSAFSSYWGAGYAPIATPDFNATEPWASMGRVVINGQTMVWLKKSYYRTENYTVGSNHYMNFSISDVPAPGYTTDPAFVINGTEIPGLYIGAFEASAYNVTTGTYVGDPASVNSQPGGDRLASVAGQKPFSGLGKASLTMAGFRNMSHNIGVGWELQPFTGISVIQRMYIIEHRNWNSQSVIGTGVTQITEDGATNMAIPTGLTAGSGANSTNCGNYTCSIATVHYQTGQATNQVSYRGIEGQIGNIVEFIDGINIKADHNPWIANYAFTTDTFSGSYSDTGVTLYTLDGYASDLAYASGFNFSFLPKTTGGSSTTYITDYCTQAAGNRIVRYGGSWSDTTGAGLFSYFLHSASNTVSRTTGARLAFTPPL